MQTVFSSLAILGEKCHKCHCGLIWTKCYRLHVSPNNRVIYICTDCAPSRKIAQQYVDKRKYIPRRPAAPKGQQSGIVNQMQTNDKREDMSVTMELSAEELNLISQGLERYEEELTGIISNLENVLDKKIERKKFSSILEDTVMLRKKIQLELKNIIKNRFGIIDAY